MKEAVREYGASILSVVIALFLFFMIFEKIEAGGGKGLIDILRTQSDVPQKEFIQYQDAQETLKAMETERPVITYQNITLPAGKDVLVTDLFVAEDADGNPAEIEVMKAVDSDGTEVEVQGERIRFHRQGISRIWVKAKDRYCGVTENMFYIPVTNR